MTIALFWRLLVIWTILIVAETFHGIARMRFLARRLGDLRSRQVCVGTGSVIIFLVTWAAIEWIGASSPSALIETGLIWCVLTVAFDVLLGRYVAHFPWRRIMQDFNVFRGGLLPFGLGFMIIAPFLAAKLRGIV
jgi:hypothetical protein